MIVMLVHQPIGAYHNQIAKAVRQLGEECMVISCLNFDAKVIESFSPDRDIIFIRTGGHPVLDVAREFERRGFRTLNDSRYIAMSAQKFVANMYARYNGVPIPELCVEVDKRQPGVLRRYLKRHGVLVAKPTYSRDMGRFVYRIKAETVEEDLRLVETIPGRRIILQSEIEFAKLVRTIVLGRKMLTDATTYDTKHPPEWKATVCSNPNAKHYTDVPDKLVELAEHTNIVFGGEVAYIDFFEKESGDYVLSEINHACALQHHEQITGVPIHRHIGRYLVDRHRELVPRSEVRAAA